MKWVFGIAKTLQLTRVPSKHKQLDIYKGHPHNRFHSFTAPMLFYSFSDDEAYAPRRAVEDFRSFFPNAPTEHQHIVPHDIGQKSIGHFGFFRKNIGESMWHETAEWMMAR